jgi:hypothetical protein
MVAGMVWDEPYLETCCRAALHRVMLAGSLGRPDGLKDGACLHRLAGMGLVAQRDDGRFGATPEGVTRHGSEVLGRATDARRR